MNLYYPLTEYLRASGCDEIEISFLELDNVLGFALPRSAYSYNAWWANGGHSQANAWLDAGYKVGKIDILKKQ